MLISAKISKRVCQKIVFVSMCLVLYFSHLCFSSAVIDVYKGYLYEYQLNLTRVSHKVSGFIVDKAYMDKISLG